MNKKAIIKLAVDILMTVALLFLSGYQFWGEALHEWVGALMFVLFIAHHLLNLSYYKNLFRGKYTAVRIITLLVDCLTLLSMLAQMYSGIVISRYVFDFLPIEGGLAFARKLHILGAYWGFIVMSLHLGLHWSMIIGVLKKALHINRPNKARTVISVAAGIMIAGYGIFAFVKRDFLTYLALKSEFVFLDYDEPRLMFYLDYIAIMGLCVFVSHYVLNLVKRIKSKSEE